MISCGRTGLYGFTIAVHVECRTNLTSYCRNIFCFCRESRWKKFPPSYTLPTFGCFWAALLRRCLPLLDEHYRLEFFLSTSVPSMSTPSWWTLSTFGCFKVVLPRRCLRLLGRWTLPFEFSEQFSSHNVWRYSMNITNIWVFLSSSPFIDVYPYSAKLKKSRCRVSLARNGGTCFCYCW